MVEAAMNNTGERTPEACLTCWITELCKLADKCAHNTKCYLEAAEDL